MEEESDSGLEKTISSNSSSSFNDYVTVDEEMIKEEERLLAENANSESNFDEEAMVVDYENLESLPADFAKEMEAEAKERKYKSLIHLLNNSRVYSLLLKDRVEKDEEVARKKAKVGRKQGNMNSSSSHSKPEKKYVLTDVITKKDIDENATANEVKEPVEKYEENYFVETRTTNLGFTVSYKQPLLLEGGAMRDYQLTGLDWMKNLFSNGVNGILADEMGLGKTIQVISFICYLIEQDIKGPFLIVAPLSTLNNWKSEFKRFSPKVPTLIYHGNKKRLIELRSKLSKKHKVLNKSVHNVVITSFEVPIRERFLKTINWHYLVIDEGHRIKNYNSQLSRTLRKFNTIGRLLLTGTPLQNNLTELWSLLNYLLPEVFDSLDVFESWFDLRELESNGTRFVQEKFNLNIVNVLQEILVPFLLRREKKDVMNLNLPPKKEVLIQCEMTPKQKKLYQATLSRSIEVLLMKKEEMEFSDENLGRRKCFLRSRYSGQAARESPMPNSSTPMKKIKRSVECEECEEEERFLININLKNSEMLLRKIMNHPYLVHFPLNKGTEQLKIDEDLIKSSGKLIVLDAILSKLYPRGHKVIIFSCFTMILDLLEDFAKMRNYKYCRLDGNKNLDEREEEISTFISDPDVFLFFISVRAGGLGINLTAADTVIFYDSDWNPQVSLQAQDRCHRIGQTKPVVVYRLCVNGTVDEKIINRGTAKRRLEKMILKEGKYTFTNEEKNTLTGLQELKELFESTNYDNVVNSNGLTLSDEKLEALLDRSDMEVN